MAILYYWGAIQWVAIRLGWLMSISLQTTAIESISLVVNIFLSVVCITIVLINVTLMYVVTTECTWMRRCCCLSDGYNCVTKCKQTWKVG